MFVRYICFALVFSFFLLYEPLPFLLGTTLFFRESNAFAVGYMSEYFLSTSESLKKEFADWDRVKYNPYEDDYFMHQSVSDNQYKLKEWNEIPRDWVGIIHMDSTQNGNPKVYI